jgi:hypothetical protein
VKPPALLLQRVQRPVCSQLAEQFQILDEPLRVFAMDGALPRLFAASKYWIA